MNTVDKWLTTARTDNPERKQFWLETIGSDVVPILSIIPTWAHLPGVGEALVYLLDVKALKLEQQERLVRFLADRFGLTVATAWAEWELKGVPILADDVEVMTSDVGLIANLVLDDDLDPDDEPNQAGYCRECQDLLFVGEIVSCSCGRALCEDCYVEHGHAGHDESVENLTLREFLTDEVQDE